MGVPEAHIRYDSNYARGLLDELGIRDVDGDGLRENPDGSPLIIGGTGAESRGRLEALEKRDVDRHPGAGTIAGRSPTIQRPGISTKRLTSNSKVPGLEIRSKG